jgi:Mrp family chromosome partitioning ATPase/capsular polysaccharide biosynthesis protein
MNTTTNAPSIFTPLWRRKWLILAVGIVVAAGTYLYYKRERPTYSTSTQVYLGAGYEELAPGEKAAAKVTGAGTSEQAAVINTIVVERVRKQLRHEHRGKLIHGVKVKAKPTAEKSEFIAISAEGHSAKGVAQLVNLTARTYIARQRTLHQRAVEKAIAITRRQLRREEAANAGKAAVGKGKNAGPSTTSILQQATLNTKINQLESSLYVSGPEQVKPASAAGATLLSPEPRKNAEFGFVLGIALAAIAVYILSRFDRRLRSLAGVEQIFGPPILAALPKAGSPVIRRDGQPAPSKLLLEPVRRLQVGLDLAQVSKRQPEAPGRVILFISPDAGDGKSSLVADLGLVQRDAARQVAIVEANFRRPVQARLLGMDDAQGLAAVLAGTLPVSEALLRVGASQVDAPPPLPLDDAPTASTVVQARTGSLSLLAAGAPVANPPALLASEAMHELVRSLAAEFDYVLIDAPSPLEFSDAMPLLNLVDGIVVVARMGHTRENSAMRLVQLLGQASSAPVFGVVANCVTRADSERYGFSAPSSRSRSGRLSAKRNGR